ncbi:TRAP transporter substrate-binding protein [Calderihabitans maritimus]|uniref:Family 7 extracellular solute-binding protein n=1 Tax=Calderihabitans maritimus TaxID=1246530 RepID=A0A1Z5HSN2_9FIRM|nr:TRAP transporter substrate-binding protein [Calderihabitans maritimus]GAW92536.1 family 7 extracellular solute-binding protein [Calderihabitans maritimus]
MKNKVLLLAMAGMLMASLLLSGCTAGKETTTAKPETGKEAETVEPISLKYAFFAPAGTFPAVQMEKWAEEVEKRTNGKVKVETFPGGTLLGAKNMYDGVLQGVADIGLSCPSYEPGRFPLLSLVDLPVSFPNAKVASLVLWDLVQEFQPESLKDFKVVTVFATEPAYIQSVSPVRNLDDIKGMELRTPGTGVPVLEALGAAPVGMPQSEVSQALQTGAIEGYVSSREVLKDLKYAEKVKYVTDYPTFVISFAALMNKDVWNSLPADVQKVIDDLGREMALWTGEYLDEHVKEAVDWAIKEQGVQIVTLSPEEKAKWDAELASLQDEAVEKLEAQGLPAREFMDRLYELRDKYSKEYQ